MHLQLAVPTRNAGRYLEATLASLDAQSTYARWWLQDGASTDDTVAIARQHARPGDVIRSTADPGQAAALNAAFAAMGGEIVGFINGDDLLSPGAAQCVVEYFAAHSEVDLVYGEVEWISPEGQVTGVHQGRIGSLAEILDIYEVWWNRRQWVQPEVFFRRSLWTKVGGFDTRYQLAFDFDFWVRCFLAGARVARIPRVLAQFRLHGAQKSQAAQQAAQEIRTIAESHLFGAPVDRALASRLRTQLDYDRYHLGEPPYAERKPGFARYLLTHPRAFALAPVRQRLRRSLTARRSP